MSYRFIIFIPLFVYSSTDIISVHNTESIKFIWSSFRQSASMHLAIVAAVRSSLGIVTGIKGPTRAFPITEALCAFKCSSLSNGCVTDPYPSSLLTQKWWSCNAVIFPKSGGFIHLVTPKLSRLWSCCSHVIHWSGTNSEHSETALRHKSKSYPCSASQAA